VGFFLCNVVVYKIIVCSNYFILRKYMLLNIKRKYFIVNNKYLLSVHLHRRFLLSYTGVSPIGSLREPFGAAQKLRLWCSKSLQRVDSFFL